MQHVVTTFVNCVMYKPGFYQTQDIGYTKQTTDIEQMVENVLCLVY